MGKYIKYVDIDQQARSKISDVGVGKVNSAQAWGMLHFKRHDSLSEQKRGDM